MNCVCNFLKIFFNHLFDTQLKRRIRFFCQQVSCARVWLGEVLQVAQGIDLYFLFPFWITSEHRGGNRKQRIRHGNKGGIRLSLNCHKKVKTHVGSKGKRVR